MFFSLSKTISKFGGFRLGVGIRITKNNVLWMSLIVLFINIFKLMWYAVILCFWLIYAVFYGIYWLALNVLKCRKQNVSRLFLSSKVNNEQLIDSTFRDQTESTYNMQKPIYSKWWFWIVVCVIIIGGLIGLFSGENDVSISNNSTITEKNASNDEIEHSISDENIDNPEISNTYVEDVIVNRFINKFNTTSKYDMINISKGNVRTKYFAYANDCYIEMINANSATAHCFSIKINGGQDISDRDKMFEVFSEILKILDTSLTDESINSTVNYFKEEKHMVNNYKINETITIENYVPIVELSYGKSSCRIDIVSYNFR